MNILKLQFEAKECNGWPKLRFLIDDDLYQDFEFSQTIDSVEIPVDLLDGPHELRIDLHSKTHNNTIIVDDTIINDQLVTLTDIYVDNIRIPDFIKYKGTYCVDNNIFPQALTWGQNGFWLLNFEYPIINWILEIKLSMHYNTQEQWSVATYHPKKIKLLTQMLQELGDMLNDDKI
jgi:hypothetical protein